MIIDWKNLYKIIINNPSDEFTFHEVVKLIIVKNIMLRYKNKRKHHFVYTEHVLDGKKADVYHYNYLKKDTVCYEIQKNISEKWLSETRKIYDNLGVDWILIDLNKLSKNIDTLNKQIKELIV